jgi:hypothetical protein
MNEKQQDTETDLISWKNSEKKLTGRGNPRQCKCGSVVISKTLKECPICRGLLPKIEVILKKRPDSNQ